MIPIKTLSRTRITYDSEGDVEREKELKGFAMNQQFILHDLMKFQGLEQDQRRIDMTDGSVITIKSCFGDDRIEIYSPLDEVIEVALPIESQCGVRNLVFISVVSGNTLQFHRYSTITGALSLIKTLDLNNFLGNASSRIVNIISGHGDMNAIVVMAFTENWRGSSIYDFYHPVKIPVSFYADDKIEAGMQGTVNSRYPGALNISKSGLMSFFAFEVVGTTGGYFSFPINQFSAVGPYKQFPVTLDPAHPPYGYFRWFFSAVETHGDLLILAMYELNVYSGETGYAITQAFIAIYSSPFWMGFAPVYQRDFPLDIDLNQRPSIAYIAQMVVHVGKLYVFYGAKFGHADSIEGPIIGIEVEVYDLELTPIISKQGISGVSGNALSPISVVSDGEREYFCFKTHTLDDAGVDASDLGNPVYLIDPESLTIVSTIDIGSVTSAYQYLVYGNHTPNFIALTEPITNYFLNQINIYRFSLSGHHEYNQFYNYTMPIGYIGYSCDLEECARLHAEWLVANGREQHEDANGNLVYDRGEVFGYRHLATGENIAIIDTTIFTTEESQIDEVLRMWKESSGHNFNLVSRDLNCMGYYACLYPVTVHSIIVGDGAYLPGTGTYSVEESTITLSPEQYGKIKIFVYNVAEG